MTDREKVAHVMVAAMGEWSEDRYAAGWLVDLEKILYRSDEPIAEGLRLLGSLFDVWPVMADEGQGTLINGWWYHLLTFVEADNRYAEGVR